MTISFKKLKFDFGTHYLSKFQQFQILELLVNDIDYLDKKTRMYSIQRPTSRQAKLTNQGHILWICKGF